MKEKSNKCALFLNGEKPLKAVNLDEYHSLYCVDGAYAYMQQANIQPDWIVGDFDSIEQLPHGIKHIHTPDQNFTDFEKALKIVLSHGFKYVDVFAANGLQQDHFLGNMSTALKYQKKLTIKFFDDHQCYYFIGNKTVLTQVKGKTISLFPFPKARKVTSTGLKFPLLNHKLTLLKNKIGIRNCAVNDTVSIRFKKGHLLLFIEK